MTFFWLIWPFEFPILTILTMTKYHETSLRDSPLSSLFVVQLFSSLKTKMILKTPNKTFLRITRYQMLPLSPRLQFTMRPPENYFVSFFAKKLVGILLIKRILVRTHFTLICLSREVFWRLKQPFFTVIKRYV